MPWLAWNIKCWKQLLSRLGTYFDPISPEEPFWKTTSDAPPIPLVASPRHTDDTPWHEKPTSWSKELSWVFSDTQSDFRSVPKSRHLSAFIRQDLITSRTHNVKDTLSRGTERTQKSHLKTWTRSLLISFPFTSLLITLFLFLPHQVHTSFPCPAPFFFRPSPSRLSPGRNTVFVPLNELCKVLHVPSLGRAWTSTHKKSSLGCKPKSETNSPENQQNKTKNHQKKNSLTLPLAFSFGLGLRLGIWTRFSLLTLLSTTLQRFPIISFVPTDMICFSTWNTLHQSCLWNSPQSCVFFAPTPR